MGGSDRGGGRAAGQTLQRDGQPALPRGASEKHRRTLGGRHRQYRSERVDRRGAGPRQRRPRRGCLDGSHDCAGRCGEHDDLAFAAAGAARRRERRLLFSRAGRNRGDFSGLACAAPFTHVQGGGRACAQGERADAACGTDEARIGSNVSDGWRGSRQRCGAVGQGRRLSAARRHHRRPDRSCACPQTRNSRPFRCSSCNGHSHGSGGARRSTATDRRNSAGQHRIRSSGGGTGTTTLRSTV